MKSLSVFLVMGAVCLAFAALSALAVPPPKQDFTQEDCERQYHTCRIFRFFEDKARRISSEGSSGGMIKRSSEMINLLMGMGNLPSNKPNGDNNARKFD